MTLLPLLAVIAMQAGTPSGINVIATDMMSQLDSPTQIVVRTDAEWVALWQKHSPQTKPPAVDFASRTVVAVFLGSRPTAGYSAEITGTRQENGALVVEWREQRPNPRDILAQVLTSPATIVSIPKFAGEIRFEKAGSR